jgi:hypothetical protein
MINAKRIIVIVLATVVFGTLMSLRASVQLGWQSAIIAALAFAALGILIRFLRTKRT